MPRMSKPFDGIGAKLARLVSVAETLRGPEGCPWDKEQTRETLKPFLIEEAYEVAEAIEKGGLEPFKEELGDLLYQVVFHAQIAKERGEFDLGDILETISEKLIRRHPHVFGKGEEKVKRGSSAEVLRHWESAKKREKGGRRSVLDGVPQNLPALLFAHQVQSRAARVGFDWPKGVSGRRQLLAKVREEIGELEEAIRAGKMRRAEEEMGDLLFSVVNYARFLGLSSEDALRGANRRFAGRFSEMERRADREGRALSTMTLKEKDRLWERAKRANRRLP